MRPILIDTNAYVSFKLGKQSIITMFSKIFTLNGECNNCSIVVILNK